MMNTTDTTTSPNLLIATMIIVGGLTLVLILLLAQPLRSTAAPTASIVLDEAVVKAGRTIFLTVCASCHGPEALGVQGLGKPLVGSEFFNSRSNAELLVFLQNGRPVNDPLNTTGVAMPARGGRLHLTDIDLESVIVYIRSLNTT
jgi:mono/diheme cytochrome c family protein